MFVDDSGDFCLRKFPVERSTIDPNETPFVASLPETIRAFRRAAGYDLRFARVGSAFFSNSTNNSTNNSTSFSTNDENEDARFETRETTSEPFEQVDPFEQVARFPVGNGAGVERGELVLRRGADLRPQLDWSSACELVASLANVLSENYSWRAKLEERESELALCAVELDTEKASVYSRAKTSTRLRDILRSGARALGAYDAASLALLDSATTSLKTRVVWGLPDDRYLEPPRPLRGARAEVEALMGNAVVLNDVVGEHWKAPEDFPCSVCAPVVSESTILGVLWFFSNERREVGIRELETLGLISGRVVAELERESLCSVCARSKERKTETETETDDLDRFVDLLVAKRRDYV